MQMHTHATDLAEAKAADERWSAWVARGVTSAKKAQWQVMVVSTVIAVGLGIALAVALSRS